MQYKVQVTLKFGDKNNVEKAMEIAQAVLIEHSDGCMKIEDGAFCLSDICIPDKALMVVKFKPNKEEGKLLIIAKSPDPIFIFHYLKYLKEAINKELKDVKININLLEP